MTIWQQPPSSKWRTPRKPSCHPRRRHGIGAGVEKYRERPAQALLTMDSLAHAVIFQGNTCWFKSVTPRCKAKAKEDLRVQLLQVHLPVVVISRYCEGTNTWAFTVHGGPGSGKYEHVMYNNGMYDNGVGARRGATWLQAAIRKGGAAVPPPVAVRYMDEKIAEYVGWKETGMLGRLYQRLTWKCEVGAQLGLKRLIWG